VKALALVAVGVLVGLIAAFLQRACSLPVFFTASVRQTQRRFVGIAVLLAVVAVSVASLVPGAARCKG